MFNHFCSLGYLPHLYYWDVFTFLRNITLSVIIVFLDSSTSDGNYQQGLAALLVFMSSTALHFAFLPYEVKELNYLEGLGLIVCMLTLYLGLWTFSITWAVSSIIVSVIIFIINSIWLLCVMVVLSTAFGSKMRSALVKCSRILPSQWRLKLGNIDDGVHTDAIRDVVVDVTSLPRGTSDDRSGNGGRFNGDQKTRDGGTITSSVMINPLHDPHVKPSKTKAKGKEVTAIHCLSPACCMYRSS
jgi:hypothetical protein